MSKLLTIALVSGAALLVAAPQPPPFHRPLVFEPNRGQAPASTTWTARSSGYQLLFTSDSLTMLVREPSPAPSARSNYSKVRVKLEGSRPWNDLTGLEPTGGYSNYVRLGDNRNEQTGVPNFAKLRAGGVYEGIDLLFHDHGGDLEYDFTVAPGADPSKIHLAFEGVKRMRLDDTTGDLVLTTAAGSELRHARPNVYQQIGGRRVDVPAGYKLLDHSRVAFALSSYDRRHPLVIDPVVGFIRTFGGFNPDEANALAVDATGNSYVTGYTSSPNFPLVHPYDSTNDCDSHTFLGFCAGGADAFVTKLDPAGTIVFSTFFGGGDIDEGDGIAVDSTGIYVTGSTGVWFNNANPSSGNGFVLKLTLDGKRIFSEQFGGSNPDSGSAIALDSHHNVWVTGRTTSPDFPLKNSEFYRFAGGGEDAFILEMSTTGVLLFSERLGGTEADAGNGIAVDRNDNVWVTGRTCSADFPGAKVFLLCSAFVSEFTGQRLDHTTILPGIGTAIVADGADHVYVAGSTSANFPATPGSFQPAAGSAQVAGFIARLNPLGNIENATFLAGGGVTNILGMALDSGSAVFVAGSTNSIDFPGAPGVIGKFGFLSKLSPDLSSLFYTVTLGTAARSAVVFEPTPVVNAPQIFVAGGSRQNPDDVTPDAFVDRLYEGPYVRLRNFWKPDQYINIESGTAASGPIAPGWLSAQWEFRLQPATNGDPAGESVFWIQNRWHPDQYLNLESGQVKSTSIEPGWLSARWIVEQVPGTHLYRVRSAWIPSWYLNIESGGLTAGPIDTASAPFPWGWWSAMWTFERPY